MNLNLFGILRTSSVRITALRCKHRTAKRSMTPYDILRHEPFQQVFGMSAAQAEKTLHPVKFDPKLFDGVSDQVKEMFTVQHFGADEVAEAAVKVLAEKAKFTYSESDDLLEIAALRSVVKVWYFQAMYRTTSMESRRRGKAMTMKQHNHSNKLLEDLRNLQFEKYAKIMEMLDLTLHFEPEIIIPGNRLTKRIETMKVQALAYKLKTEARARERDALFNKTKEHFRQKILQDESAISSV